MDHDKIDKQMARLAQAMDRLGEQIAGDLPDSESDELTMYQHMMHIAAAHLNDHDFANAHSTIHDARRWKDDANFKLTNRNAK